MHSRQKLTSLTGQIAAETSGNSFSAGPVWGPGSVTFNARYRASLELLRRAERSDATAATRSQVVDSDRFVEGAYPAYGRKARGAYVWDIDGHKYIDFILAYGTVILGHVHPAVTRAVIKEIRQGFSITLPKPTQVDLAEFLVSRIPGAELALFLKTGSDATTAAVRLARIFTGRPMIVRWGYNGWHDWACPRQEGVPATVQGDILTFRYNELDPLKRLFESYPDRIACVLMMPFELEPPHPGFLEGVRQIAHSHGALFILDEIRSGFRMALGGAQEYFGINADVATFSKAMANGYAISAVVGRADVLRCLAHTHMVSTFYANSAAMAAALATLSVLASSPAIPHIWNMGKAFLDGLANLVQEYEVEAEVVGYPPMPYLRFTCNDVAEREYAKNLFYTETARAGVLFHPNHHWFISAAMTVEDISKALRACEKGFTAIKKSQSRS